MAQGLAVHEGLPAVASAGGKKPRGRPRRRPGPNLWRRLQGHKDDAWRFLINPAVPFTNNQAERDMRMRKLKQKISGCFRSETGAQVFAPLRTVLSTARKQGWTIFDTLAQPTDILTLKLRTA